MFCLLRRHEILLRRCDFDVARARQEEFIEAKVRSNIIRQGTKLTKVNGKVDLSLSTCDFVHMLNGPRQSWDDALGRIPRPCWCLFACFHRQIVHERHLEFVKVLVGPIKNQRVAGCEDAAHKEPEGAFLLVERIDRGLRDEAKSRCFIIVVHMLGRCCLSCTRLTC